MRKPFLNRGNLRNVIIGAALISAVFCSLTWVNLIVSLILFTAGSLLSFITKGILVRDTVLCEKGVYRICRHPYYLANFIIDISLCLLSGNIYLVMAYPFLFFWAYGPTLKKEESFLSRKFARQSPDYLLEHPQILPSPTSDFFLGEIIHEFSWKRISPNQITRHLRFCTMIMTLIIAHVISKRGARLFHPLDHGLLILGGIWVLLALSGMACSFVPGKPKTHLKPAAVDKTSFAPQVPTAQYNTLADTVKPKC